jgi:vitamin B12 transporter
MLTCPSPFEILFDPPHGDEAVNSLFQRLKMINSSITLQGKRAQKLALNQLSRAAQLALLVIAFSAQAQTQSTQFRDVVVTANRTPEQLADVLADVTVITAHQIESSGASTLPQLMSRVAGVQVSQNGGPAGVSSVFLRGASNEFTTVLIDGIRIDSQNLSGGVSWESIPLGEIDHIEILKGAAASVYGTSAIGGVVQIFTKKASSALEPEVQMGVGSYGTVKESAALGGQTEVMDYHLGVTQTLSKGYNTLPNSLPNQNDGYSSNAFQARLGFSIASDERLELTHLSHHLVSDYNDAQGDPKQTMGYQLGTTGLNLKSRWDDAHSSVLTLSQTLNSLNYYGYGQYETTLRNVSFQNDWHWSDKRLSLILENQEDHLQTPSSDPLSGVRRDAGVTMAYGLKWGAQALQMNARLDHDSTFGDHPSSSISYGYQLTSTLRSVLSWGSAFRSPTLYQLYSSYGVSSLKPETSQNTEIALNYIQGLDQWSIIAFRNQVNHLILGNPNSSASCAAGYYCYTNVNEALLQGVSASAQTPMGPYRLRASLDFINSKDLATGAQLIGRAKTHGVLSVERDFFKSNMGVELVASGTSFANDPNTQSMGGYGLLNFFFSQDLDQGLKLLARVDNLGNKVYATTYNLPGFTPYPGPYASPGRSVFVSLKWAP